MDPRRLLELVVVAGAAGLVGCATPCAAAHDDVAWTRAIPARPAACREVALGEPLAVAIAAATPGAALCLAPGRHRGPVTVPAGVTVWGPTDAVIVSDGTGTTVQLTGAGSRLAGVTIDGSGGRYDKLDGAVLVRADDVTIEGVTIVGAVYGILVEQAHRTRLVGNHVRGSADPSIGLRGDTIRLWETDDALITGNLVEDGRDMVVWYSRRAQVRDNDVRRARYGTHFMYSHDSHVEGNRYVDVTVGVFVMYTRGITLRGNLIANAAGAAGIAIGLKDSGSVTVTDNLLVRDEVGIYVDATPQRHDEHLEIRANQVRLCRTAIVFHASSHRVGITANDFAGNDLVTRVDGGGDALDVAWRGNYFDDYAGYDLDDDGTGDVPFELRSFSDALVGRQPELAFFHGTPALAMADAAAHLDPLYRPRPLLVDPQPRMRAVATGAGVTRRPREP